MRDSMTMHSAWAIGLARMFARCVMVLFVAACLTLACFALRASAAPADIDGGATGSFGIGALSDRYESLKELGNSLTDEEGVVIATRIGVLVSTNRALNNSEVSFTGETVGSVVFADDTHEWANMLGASNSVISVYLTDEQAALIQYAGDYHNTGTMLKIVGIYHIACPEHQGELDVHATSAEVVDSGGPVTHLVEPGKLVFAFIACVAAALLLAAYLWARRYLANRDDS